jgi:hypothetical protein
MAKRDIPRERIGELIEEMLIHPQIHANFFEDASVELEADGWVSVRLPHSEGKPIYDIRVTRRKT